MNITADKQAFVLGFLHFIFPPFAVSITNNKLIPWSTAARNKLLVSQLIRKDVYGSRSQITMLIRSILWTLSAPEESNSYLYTHFFRICFNIYVSSSRLCLCLPSSRLPSVIPCKFLYEILISLMVAICQIYSIY